MEYNEMQQLVTSITDIGHSRLLQTPMPCRIYDGMELYFVPINVYNYGDPLFSKKYPMIGVVTEITDNDDEDLKKDLYKTVCLEHVSDLRTDGTHLYTKQWHMIIQIHSALITNPYMRKGTYDMLIKLPTEEFDKQYHAAIEPYLELKQKSLYKMVTSWSQMELIEAKQECCGAFYKATKLETRLLQLAQLQEEDE
jgi:hypothetical protein